MQQNELIAILDRAHAARILVLGDVMLDQFIYGSVARVSPEAPIPVLDVSHSKYSAGGAANVARNVASIGAQATLIGVAGADQWAEDLKAQIQSSPGIDAHLVIDSERPTTVKTRYVADGQQVLRADRELRDSLSEDTALRLLGEFTRALPQTDVVVLSDYAKGVLSEGVTRAAIAAARTFAD
jgi:D-beta-D-heptose 7-phosphate kinase / D-beta-D-heptose 1-phosphate adenosyltransferase